jgi:glycosyltransferase involved in cell wall biosynthesis
MSFLAASHVPRHIVLVTDAWHPQVNGVVQTWTYMCRELEALGHRVTVVNALGSKSLAIRSEPGLRLCTEPTRHLKRVLRDALGSATAAPDALHIATEGPLGIAARRLALRLGWRFTTSYHTRFPEYLKRRFGFPAALTYRFMRWFHRPAQHVLVPTQAMLEELRVSGFDAEAPRLRVWSRGVDAERFVPGRSELFHLPRPIWLNVGRVAPEKNLEAFLSLPLPGSKVVIGSGPAEPELRARYPDAHWLGAVDHERLGCYYAAADVFVFPSRTDTFGLVMLESMACGTPVAAFPVTGPIDVVLPGITGSLNANLHEACLHALELDRDQVRAEALNCNWRAIAEVLLAALVPVHAGAQGRT